MNRRAALVCIVAFSVVAGCKKAPERPVNPGPYLTVAEMTLEAMGLPSSWDVVASAKVRRGAAGSSQTGRPIVKVRTKDYTFKFEEATRRVVIFIDRAAHDETIEEYERLKSGADFDEAQYEKSQMTEEEAVRMVEESGYFALFDVDVNGLGLRRIPGRFRGDVYSRGWAIGYERHYHGYAFRDEAVWFGVDDRRRKVVSYSYRVSPKVPPVPRVSVQEEEVPEIVRRWVSGLSVGAIRLRAEGYAFRPSTLEVEPKPQYLHTNFAFGLFRVAASYSMTHPLHLAYICEFKIEKKDPEPYKEKSLHIQMWIDTHTGRIVGGDARSTTVVKDSERAGQ